MAVETSITVRVRLFASYREAAGTGKLGQALPSGSTVRDLVAALSDRVPSLANGKGLVAVNLDYVEPDFVLHGGEEVAFIPPVSGGAA